MELTDLRNKKLTFKDTFIYLKMVLFGNFLNFLKLLVLWILFSAVFLYLIRYFSPYFIALFSIFAYVFFYLIYLAFIAQSRAVIDQNKLGVFESLKEVFKGFLHRKGLDLLAMIPVAVVALLINFFPSSIFAVPLAFIITLATLIFISYTILTQPVLVIKKLKVIAAIRYSTGLINGYFAFVLGLCLTLALGCLVLYIPLSFIKAPLVYHQFIVASFIGVEVMLFAIMLSVVYTNLEIAWSVGFKQYDQDDFTSEDNRGNNHEFTEFFNRVPEVEIKEDDTKEDDIK